MVSELWKSLAIKSKSYHTRSPIHATPEHAAVFSHSSETWRHVDPLDASKSPSRSTNSSLHQLRQKRDKETSRHLKDGKSKSKRSSLLSTLKKVLSKPPPNPPKTTTDDPFCPRTAVGVTPSSGNQEINKKECCSTHSNKLSLNKESIPPVNPEFLSRKRRAHWPESYDPIVFTKTTTATNTSAARPHVPGKSLLSAQLQQQNEQTVMKTKAKLEAAAARRKMIKYYHMREQADATWLETLQMKSGHYGDAWHLEKSASLVGLRHPHTDPLNADVLIW
ncbi:uncharacterized protein BYT42DRAFT_255694 [Radiomyces spectabilis]|uniref:uncharacterized protein n=1 Tax=Radiomyces spectabilis TaxID=64574 RepID=UPI0022209E39|nr:uncharacterized protein BYT42DRAFT_255694 [Radiomyces spectabilis]KAI8384286.1 hypothetical protein BYT42DRAFT_255694 [Radiomyces spectabilis]